MVKRVDCELALGAKFQNEVIGDQTVKQSKISVGDLYVVHMASTVRLKACLHPARLENVLKGRFALLVVVKIMEVHLAWAKDVVIVLKHVISVLVFIRENF